MSNHFFQFKQFKINQDQCAMKVSTDACVFGAFVAKHEHALNPSNALDIGSGTGLLSLMLAQKLTNTKIDAVEFDIKAAQQCKENFRESSWTSILTVFQESIQVFSNTSNSKYDLIICNPPFFPNHLKSSNTARLHARHTDLLSFDDLLSSVEMLLADRGNFYGLLPTDQLMVFLSLAASFGFMCSHVLHIRERTENKNKRTVFKLQRKTTETLFAKSEELVIRDNQGNYSSEFSQLLKDYYLIF